MTHYDIVEQADGWAIIADGSYRVTYPTAVEAARAVAELERPTPREGLIEIAASWRGGPGFNRCPHGGIHDFVTVETEHGLFTVYDEERYQYDSCIANDEVSKSLRVNGGWEFPATKIIQEDLVAGEAGVVLDFGAQLGWYSVLAARAGHHVLAVDAEAENLQLLSLNAARWGVLKNVMMCRAWIDKDTPPATLPPDGTRIRLIKADVEGAENDVIRICQPLLDAQLVDQVLMEVSPVFSRRGMIADHYPTTIMRILACGYSAWLIPPNVPDAQLTPIENPIGFLDDIEQADVLFRLET